MSLFLYLITSSLSIFVIFFTIENFKYGIDFADESYYLLSIANPERYAFSISQFGFVYKPLFFALNNNIFSSK